MGLVTVCSLASAHGSYLRRSKDLGRTSNASACLRRSFCSKGQSYLRQRWRLNAHKEVLSRWAVCAMLCLVLSFPWWYTTGYAIFLLLCPFLNEGIRSLDRRTHSLLCFVPLLLYSLFPYSFLNGLIRFGMSYSVWQFVCQYVLITCLRWHYSGFLLNRRLGNDCWHWGLRWESGHSFCLGFLC